MNRFVDKITVFDDKVKGHHLYWNIIYYIDSYSPYSVVYQIRFDKNWAKVILDTNRCVLYINDMNFYVETFKLAEDIICAFATANDTVISEGNLDKNTVRKLKIKNILGL
jgi:hypothetical protein